MLSEFIKLCYVVICRISVHVSFKHGLNWYIDCMTHGPCIGWPVKPWRCHS